MVILMVGLITEEAQKELLDKLVEYYKRLYPGIEFEISDVELSHEELGELFYTHPGEEIEATAAEKIRAIEEAIGGGYNTPIVVLKSGDKNLILDGHRRARVAYSQGLGWKAHIITPKKEGIEFGIEDMILGKISDLFD